MKKIFNKNYFSSKKKGFFFQFRGKKMEDEDAKILLKKGIFS